jgi:hypothetical protein
MSATAMMDSDVDMASAAVASTAASSNATAPASTLGTVAAPPILGASAGVCAHLNLRLRCDALGHGDEVFVVVGESASSASSSEEATAAENQAATAPASGKVRA